MAKEQYVPTELPERKELNPMPEFFCVTKMPLHDTKPMDSTLLKKICLETNFAYA